MQNMGESPVKAEPSHRKPKAKLGPDMIDESLPTPLYHQIFLVLRDRIRSGDFPTGAVMPGEQELTGLFNVSRITVKRAMNELAAHGFVTRHRGRGTVVAYNAAVPVVYGRFDTLFDALKRMGLETKVALLEVADIKADATLAAEMSIDEGEPVQRAVRLRSLEGDTFSYLLTHVPGDIAQSYTRDELAREPLLSLLERSGRVATEAEQTITAVAAEPHIAAPLKVSPGSPLLKIVRIMRDKTGRAIQHITAYYRPERFSYHMHLQRDAENGPAWTPVDRK